MADVSKLAGWIVGGVVATSLVLAPAPAQASPACNHRSKVHIEKHGGLHRDSRWHVEHGDLPTCDTSHDKKVSPGHKRKPRIHHRDKPGWHRDPHPILHSIF